MLEQNVRGMVILAGLSVGLCGATALAQFDAGPWPAFRGAAAKRGAVTAPGPALNLAFAIRNFATNSPGGFSIGASGDVYFKAYGAGTSKVYRLNPADGSVLMASADFGGNTGNYSGVAIGTDALYTCIHNGLNDTRILKLDKTTLAVIGNWADPAFVGLRGTPLIGSVLNSAGHVNLYIHDRNAAKLHAVDSVTGALQWSYTLIYDTPFGQAGPLWTAADGKQVIGYFGNGNFGPGAAIKDNGDGTFAVLWEAAGPGNFNWWGSGALATSGDRIYVTTFNDPVPPGTTHTDAMWAISTADGSVIWSAGGGTANHFGRPAVIDSRVYAPAAAGQVYAYDDNGASGSIAWTYTNPDPGEFTALAATRTAAGVRYIYAVQQETANQKGRLVVLRDDGTTATELLNTTLNDTMRWSLFSNCSATLAADGSLWVSGGRVDDPTPGDIYKFTVTAPCYANCDGSTAIPILNVNDFICFQTKYAAQDPGANCDGSTANPILNVNDFICFQTKFAAGCP